MAVSIWLPGRTTPSQYSAEYPPKNRTCGVTCTPVVKPTSPTYAVRSRENEPHVGRLDEEAARRPPEPGLRPLRRARQATARSIPRCVLLPGPNRPRPCPTTQSQPCHTASTARTPTSSAVELIRCVQSVGHQDTGSVGQRPESNRIDRHSRGRLTLLYGSQRFVQIKKAIAAQHLDSARRPGAATSTHAPRLGFARQIRCCSWPRRLPGGGPGRSPVR